MDATVRAMEKMRQEQARQQQLLKQTASVSSSSRRKAKTKRGAATFKDSFVGEVNRLKNLDNLTRLDQAKRRMLEDDDSDDSDDERGGGAGGGAGRNDEEKDEAVGSEGGSQQRSKSKKREKSKKSSISASDDPLRVIPEEYRLHGMDTEPLLYYLRLLPEDSSLTALLEAAQKDIRLHQARIKAAAANNHLLLEEYDFSKDPSWVDRQAKHKSRMEHMVQLQQDRGVILKDLVEDTTESKKNKNLTPEEKNQVKLARWQRALELYVYCPTDMDMDLLGLLEKLLEGTSEEEELSEVLDQAAQMCSALVDVTQHMVRDATEDAAEAEDAYGIRLEAHSLYAQNSLRQAEEILSNFRTNGRAALEIGHQLEFAESKRAQCEAASILIRRWWMMEQLAESEHVSGEPLKVSEEVRGYIPAASCRMDMLFTLPDHSEEAAKALKQLRAVVRSRRNAATAAATATGGWSDPNSARRFDLTANLIARTSAALEQRLLQSFTQIYSSGGLYDFSETPRPGSIDWKQLRKEAQALLMFDSGRNLHKRYVRMVISSRFPELFQPKTTEEDEDDDNEFNMDATRSELSSLFHRVSDVCTAEFELIAHVFGQGANDEMTLTVSRALLQRVISDPKNGLQSRISDLLESIDRRGDFEAGTKKLDTFVVIHEKAAGLFHLLKEAAEKMLAYKAEQARPFAHSTNESTTEPTINAVTALKQFLTSQEIALSSGHRKGYLNLELRLLHNNCCAALEAIGCQLDFSKRTRPDLSMADNGVLEEYRAPIIPILARYLLSCDMLSGPLKKSVSRQPLIHATDSLARARLMFGTGMKGGETTARVIASIYSQMCNFYGKAYLYPIVEALGSRLSKSAPGGMPPLQFDESDAAHDMGVPAQFWVSLEYIHSAAKQFDRELWAETRPGSARVWETLIGTGSTASMNNAKKCRLQFFAELESRGEEAIVAALDTLTNHIRWILVSGGESAAAIGGNRFFSGAAGTGPYAIPPGTSLDQANSAAVRLLTFCLRAQFVNVHAALTQQSLAAFWNAVSKRLYDVFVPRLLQHYSVTTVGAVILARDVEALRSVAMLSGANNNAHWDNLRELVTLYMTPPIALKSMLVGPDGDANSAKGLFRRVGRYTSLVFMSRRGDYRVKTAQGPRKSPWVVELLDDLGVQDPTDGAIKMGFFAAEQKN